MNDLEKLDQHVTNLERQLDQALQALADIATVVEHSIARDDALREAIMHITLWCEEHREAHEHRSPN